MWQKMLCYSDTLGGGDFADKVARDEENCHNCHKADTIYGKNIPHAQIYRDSI